MDSVMEWIVVFFQNLFVEIPTPKVMVLGGGAFRRWLGHESGHLINGIGALIKETTESSLKLCALWGHSEKKPSMNQEIASYQTSNLLSLNFGLSSLQICEKWNVCFLSHTVYGMFVVTAWTD